MVHALLACWRVLEPGGSLVDLRPLCSNPAIEMLVGQEVLVPGTIIDESGVPDDIAAHEAMAEVVQRGFFTLEIQDSFKYADYWDRLDGFLEYAAESWSNFVTIAPSVVERAYQYLANIDRPYRIRVSRKMHLAVYRKQEPGGQ